MIRIFPKLSVLDNVLLAFRSQKGENLLWAILSTPSVKAEHNKNRGKAMEILHYIELIHLKDELAGNLSYGQTKLVEIARAIATDAELFLFDEPTAGLSPLILSKVVEIIRKLNSLEKTVLLIEHDTKVVMDISDTIIVMNNGEVIASGSPEKIKKDEIVIEAYLGVQKTN